MVEIRVLEQRRPTAAEQQEVLAVAGEATRTDAAPPLGEQVLIDLDGAAVTHVTAVDGSVVGYAQVDPAGPQAELVVTPAHRRRGIGRRLVSEVLARYPRTRIWAHGTHPGAAALAAEFGLQPSRQLLNLELRGLDRLPDAPLPQGIALRTFLTGVDEPEWLALNSRAFVALPDQGGWDATDLARRQEQPWFDPAGFLVAVDPAGAMVGFHWTKVYERATTAGGHEHVGEVYVVGVDPSRRGQGLGRALTVAGLEHLRRRGLATVYLYVDAANPAAVALYRSLGFTPHHTDTEYAPHRPT